MSGKKRDQMRRTDAPGGLSGTTSESTAVDIVHGVRRFNDRNKLGGGRRRALDGYECRLMRVAA